jgi:hypothetical protein
MSKLSPQTKESPHVKDGEIFLQKQKDGNWKGFMLLNGKEIEVREIDPYTCLVKLLTHP